MSFPRYGAYKASGVEWLGDAPAHWTARRLRFCVKLNPSKSEVADLDRREEVSFVPMEAIGESGRLSLESTRALGDVESGYTYFRDGDVVVAKITPCFENGKGAIMRGLLGGAGFGTTELIVARPLDDKTTAEFLHWVFVSTPFRSQGEATMFGAGGQKRVPDDFVRDFRIAWPPLSEQYAIAAFLDRETAKIDGLVAEQERLIALLKEKRQAVISHAVTKGLDPNAPMKPSGVEWLGDVPAHWTVSRIKNLARKISKGTTPTTVDGEFTSTGVRFLKAENISQGRVNTDPEFFISEDTHVILSRSELYSGDVLVVIAGATTGKSAVLTPLLLPSNTNQAIAFVRCNERAEPQFVNYWLSLPHVQDAIRLQSVQSAQPNLSMEDLGNLEVVAPPPAEQLAIVEQVRELAHPFGNMIEEGELAIALLRERRAALISAAVTGKIDVRGLAPGKAEAA